MLDNDELSLEELENVGTSVLEQLNSVVEAFEHSDFSKVVELGEVLITNPTLDENQKKEITKMLDVSRKVIENNKAEVNKFGL